MSKPDWLSVLSLVPASFAVPVENSTVVVGNSAAVECAVDGDNPITGTRHPIWTERKRRVTSAVRDHILFTLILMSCCPVESIGSPLPLAS